ncbi:lytic transglycosylase domain-containing protein [Nitrobacter sp.]|uniref:lytic transglycosylase domain-containing protein n=1 Tax=Nitrobacter sp. TaxID=29420 RepID=UPI00399D5BCE
MLSRELSLRTILWALLVTTCFCNSATGEPIQNHTYRAEISEVSISQISASRIALARTLRKVRRSRPSARDDLQATIARAARAHSVPIELFLALIKQESAFNPDAVSVKGAQGIAQFMPATAAQRGLKNPFDPNEALFKSAELLKELNDSFRNWGLAAAAYNAGPERVKRWLAGKSALPIETRQYVQAITAGHPEWVPDGFQPVARAAGLKVKRHPPTQRELELKLLTEISRHTQPLMAANNTNDRRRTLCPACITQRFY